VRTFVRFVLPILALLALLGAGIGPLVDRLTFRWFAHDLDLRASLVVNAIGSGLQDVAESGSANRLRAYFRRITRDERLYAMAYCASAQSKPVAEPALPELATCQGLDTLSASRWTVRSNEHGPLLVSVRELSSPAGAKIVIVHDLSFAQRRSAETKHYLFYLFIGIGVIISVMAAVVAHVSRRGWIAGVRTLLKHEDLRALSSRSPELQPIADDLRVLIEDLQAERRARDGDRVSWTPEALREILSSDLRGNDVIVVSNREPYIHVHDGSEIAIQRPASGLVTAVEPIMRACSGTWIAHGSGSADRLVVDARDRVAAPVPAPGYQLRRIWLSEREEAGYYYGFANEGLWPLCHIAHVRPTFRSEDWAQYREVNQKFADAVVKEARTDSPVVLVQDYHLALVPRMIRQRLPHATIITFWHIPWPNPEAFAICPWRNELLDGLLGSSILGFHTQFHCNNFVDTVDRLLEARVDRETFGVSYLGERTLVKRYPISVRWPEEQDAAEITECRSKVRERLKLPSDQALGVGVDRMDYTKGLEERFRAVERLFELHPEWVGRFTFVQIAAPTRAIIPQYQQYERSVRDLVTRINGRFAHEGRPAIVLLAHHHDAEQVQEYYRAADVCFVSSLHDGMNLVAKEFVAARDDEDGVLVLSQFTGAARELPEALIVNPYDADECAAALDVALTMPPRLRTARMRLMRGLVQQFNVYRWAGRMLIDAAALRRSNWLLMRDGAGVKHTRASDRDTMYASARAGA
jgi:trehalose 6-phosphate synthase